MYTYVQPPSQLKTPVTACFQTLSRTTATRALPLVHEISFVTRPRGRSLDRHDHALGANERLDPRLGKACVAHPSGAICCRVVEAFPGLDQHVQAHQKPKRILPSLVVN